MTKNRGRFCLKLIKFKISNLLMQTLCYAEYPFAPFLDLTVLGGDEVQVDLSPPLSDGGTAITSYRVDWDSNPGTHEVQTITTSTYTGPNEIQVITSRYLLRIQYFISLSAI